MTNQLKIWVDEILNEQTQPGASFPPVSYNYPTGTATPQFDASGNRIWTQADQDAIMNAINQNNQITP
jgi:hypothetical protein